MTVVLVILFVSAFVMALTKAGLWAYNEGMRQGDSPEDAVAVTDIVSRPDGSYTVHIRLDNPASAPVMASVRGRWVHWLWPISGVGRTTPRRCSNPLRGDLVAVPGGDATAIAWATNVPAGRRRLVLDVHIWQRGGRLRRHRSIVGRPTPAFG